MKWTEGGDHPAQVVYVLGVKCSGEGGSCDVRGCGYGGTDD